MTGTPADEDSATAEAEPCQCHRSFAYISPTHRGHCCFVPESQTCHPEEVAEWERQRDLRRPSARRGVTP